MAEGFKSFLNLAEDLETAGLVWCPEIGDEVADRRAYGSISVLVDNQGFSPQQLRSIYLWLPTVEQIVMQIEARKAILFHAGLELTANDMCYKTVVQGSGGAIEAKAQSLRMSMGVALRGLLLSDYSPNVIN